MSSWISPAYQKEETVEQLKDHFNNNNDLKSVTLAQFFTREGLEEIIEEVMGAEFEEDYNEIMHRRKLADIASLDHVLDKDQFTDLVEQITGEKLKLPDTRIVQKYGHRDYKIIHDDTVLPPGYDIIIDLTPEWDDNLGGYVAYTDGEGEFYMVKSTFGSISIIKRDENYHYFVKYVNHYAENLNRYLVILNTEVER